MDIDFKRKQSVLTKYHIDPDTKKPITIPVTEKQQIHPLKNLIQMVGEVKKNKKIQIIDRDMIPVNKAEKITQPYHYYVDYEQNLIHFHPDIAGQTVEYKYEDMGVTVISANKIFTKQDAKGNVVELLEDIIEYGREAIDVMTTIGGVAIIMKRLEDDIKEGYKVSDKIQADIQQAKDEILNVRGNREIIIQASQWKLNANVYEKEIIHDLNSENLHVTAKNSDTKEAVTIGYKILDKTRILLKGDEPINMSIILSASYYHATQTISDNIAEEVVKARKGEADLKTKIDTIENTLTEYNVMNFGFDNTGQEDVSDKLNNLINLVYSNSGGVIKFPSGIFKISKQIVCLPHVYLLGNMKWKGKFNNGYTVFDCYEMNKPQFLLREYCSLDSFVFNYPLQVTNNDTKNPIEYDWTIATDVSKICDDIQLKDLYFPNSYKAINLTRAGRPNLTNIYGQPIYKGLLIDECLDMGNIHRIEFWTFTYYVGSSVYEYIQNNATAFEFKKVDGIICNNLFAYGYNKGYHLNGQVWATFLGCSADKCYRPKLIDNCDIVEFIGGSFIGSSFKSNICTIKNVGNSLKLKACNYFGSNNIGVLNYSNTGKVDVDVYFKDKDNKIKIAICNSGNGEMYIKRNSINDIILGGRSTFIDGVCSESSNSELVKTLNYNNLESSEEVAPLNNGFRILMDKPVQNVKVITSKYRIDDKQELPTGLYTMSFRIKGVFSSDRKRMAIQARRDDGSVIYNRILEEIPLVEEETRIILPFYLGEKPYISYLQFEFQYYDEPNQTHDYIDITDIEIWKMHHNIFNSTIEYLYMKSYTGNLPINYNIIN